MKFQISNTSNTSTISFALRWQFLEIVKNGEIGKSMVGKLLRNDRHEAPFTLERISAVF